MLLHRAIGALRVDMTAVDPAVDAGLMTIDTRVEFAHLSSAPPPIARPRLTTAIG